MSVLTRRWGRRAFYARLAWRVWRHSDRCEFCRLPMTDTHDGWLCEPCAMWREK